VDYQFDWDPHKDQQNRRKHRLSFRQAATVFRDPDQISIYDTEHSEDEERWITIGRDNSGVVRVVIHTFEQSTTDSVGIRIISARKATAVESQHYRTENR